MTQLRQRYRERLAPPKPTVVPKARTRTVQEIRRLEELVHTDGLLFTCHDCQLIGTQTESMRHQEETGHKVEAQTQKDSDAIRTMWLVELGH